MLLLLHKLHPLYIFLGCLRVWQRRFGRPWRVDVGERSEANWHRSVIAIVCQIRGEIVSIYVPRKEIIHVFMGLVDGRRGSHHTLANGCLFKIYNTVLADFEPILLIKGLIRLL